MQSLQSRCNRTLFSNTASVNSSVLQFGPAVMSEQCSKLSHKDGNRLLDVSKSMICPLSMHFIKTCSLPRGVLFSLWFVCLNAELSKLQPGPICCCCWFSLFFSFFYILVYFELSLILIPWCPFLQYLIWLESPDAFRRS